MTTALAWNCRGIGGSLVSDTLRNLCTCYHPLLLFLSETKSFLDGVLRLIRSLGYLPSNTTIVECSSDYVGGLVLAWHPSIYITVIF